MQCKQIKMIPLYVEPCASNMRAVFLDYLVPLTERYYMVQKLAHA